MPVEEEKTKEAEKMINTKHYQSIPNTEPTLWGRVHWGLRHKAGFSLHYHDCCVIILGDWVSLEDTSMLPYRVTEN